MKKSFIFLLAFIMAGVTTFLFFNYVQGMSAKKAASPEEMVTVVGAKVAIKQDTQITDQMVVLYQVPKKAMQPDAMTSIADVTGKVAKIDIEPGETILNHHIETVKDSPYLSGKIKSDYRAVTVTAKMMADTVGNLIEPGDRVDVVFTVPGKTLILLQNIQVLAVDQRLTSSNQKEPYKPYTMTTLEVTPADAVKIIDAEQKGNLILILRSAISTSKEG